MLKVEGLNGKTGGYRTRVFYQAVSDAEMEYNNTKYLSNTITVGSALRGTISQAKDIYFYSFQALKDNVGYEISLGLADSASPKTGSWYITIAEGKNGDIVAGTEKLEVKAGETKTVSTEALVAGRNYYITVESGSTLTTEIYKLGVAAIKPADSDKPDTDVDFRKQIKEYFNIFWGNFSEWVDEVNFVGIITGILPGIVKALPELFTWLFSLIG